MTSHPIAIRQLEAGPRSREAVDAFVAGHSFPIVEGSAITFVWRGDAEAVHLKHWVYGLPSSQQLQRVADTDIWYLVLALPPESRVEYKLEVVRHGHGDNRRLGVRTHPHSRGRRSRPQPGPRSLRRQLGGPWRGLSDPRVGPA